jgi:hypothetical protein
MVFKDYFQDLKPIAPRTEFRDEVIKQCGIGYSTFYIWMRYPEQVPRLAREKIAEIANKDVFDLFPEPVNEE